MPTRKQTIEDIPAEYLPCRDLQHSWAPNDVKVTSTHIVRTLQCRACPVKREQTLTLTGRIVRSRMDYSGAHGYLLKGVGRLTQRDRAAIRLASISLSTS